MRRLGQYLYKGFSSSFVLIQIALKSSKKRDSIEQSLMQPLQDYVAFSLEKKMDEISTDMINGVWSDDHSKQLDSMTKFNKILSSKNSSTEKVIQSGVVRRFVEFLKKEDSPDLQYEAAKVLANIAYHKNAKLVIDHEAVPIFVHLLAGATDNDDIRLMAVWALCNVAAGSIQCRDYVLRCGTLMPLLDQLHEHNGLTMLRLATCTLSNLCGGQPPPPFSQVKLALSAIGQVLHLNDDRFLSNSCHALWAMSNDGSEEKIQSLIEAGLVPRLVQLLQHTSPSVIATALSTICNIVTGNLQQTQFVINCGVLPILANLLTQNYAESIKMDVCWMISNITARNEEEIQSVLGANLIPILINLAQNAESDIKQLVVHAISNATYNASHDQIRYMVEQSCIKPLCDLLECPHRITILECLAGLENILKVGEVEKNTGEVNSYCQLIKDAQGKEKIENLQNHDQSIEICHKAMKIMVKYVWA